MQEVASRITVNPNQCGGRPCIRGMRIRVIDIIDLIQSGMSFAEIVAELPDLEVEDIKAALAYVRRRADHAVLTA